MCTRYRARGDSLRGGGGGVYILYRRGEVKKKNK